MSAADAERRFIMSDGASKTTNEGCPFGAFRSHKFEPRYDLGPADLSMFSSIKSVNATFLESLRTKTYVRDVCIKCGKTIERKP